MTHEANELILADLIRARAEERPDLDVLTFEGLSRDAPDEVRTYAELATNANRLAANLIAKGVSPGDRFAIMMRNHPEFVEAMTAASITGGVFVPIDPRTRGEKLAYMLAKSGSVGAVIADYCLPQLLAVRNELPDFKWVIVVDTDVGGETRDQAAEFERFSEILSIPAETVEVPVDDGEAPLQVMFTSGTTGDPKGIVGKNSRFCMAGMLAALFDYHSDDRPYSGLSLTHGNAQAVTLAPALTSNLRAVFSRRFTKSRLWDVCRHYGCTLISLVGGMSTAIYSQPERPDDADNPVRVVTSGGMPPAIWEAFERRFGVQILEFYGAMDGGGMAYKPAGVGPIGSFGKPMPGIDMRVLDEEGNECPPGVMGEISVRPATGEEASVEYFGDKESSRKKIKRGWNRSGDIGHRDEEGWLFFDYRAGGGIRHNGDFINPSYVEKAIAEHPSVGDVYVYGVPAASGAPGEKDIVAAVVPLDHATFDPTAVFAVCREKLEANFVPSYLQIVDEIPKTASEKPQERLLRERFAPAAGNVVKAS